MKHFGDITKIHGCAVPITDCVIGGSPCQDLSVAGKREGLAGARSGLFMEQIRIVKEMRYADQCSGRTGQFIRPRYMVWENVPGAFSSNDTEDFRAVLEETARVADANAAIPRPPKKWANAGCILGDGWSIAWHVLDAQFWGVPQRRRRIALVADFGGHTAPEILFERDGLCWDSAQGGEAGEGTARDSAGSIGEAIGFDGYNQRLTGSVSQGIRANKSDGDHVGMICYGIGGFNSKGMLSGNPKAGIYEADTSRTLDLNGGNPACNQGGICVAQCYDMTHATDVIRECGETSPTLQSRMGTGGNQVQLTFGIGNGQANQEFTLEQTGALNCMHDQRAIATFQNTGRGWWNQSDIAECIRTPSGGDSTKANLASDGYAVRRLTPLECERLQGYPDGWTLIGEQTVKHRKQYDEDTGGLLYEYDETVCEYIDSNGKRKQSSDSARYKALGNSIALPPWKWVLKRLCAFYERDATMASLFDGIGGFPLIWEQLNGKGSCLWASEIEEFPIAVTKRHFSELEATL